MSNFGPAPSRMTTKISPSLSPRSHVASVRSEGWVPSGALGPLPLALAPWQDRQFLGDVDWPALIGAGVEHAGFFIFFASGLPPGFCAATPTVRTNAHAHAEIMVVEGQRMTLINSLGGGILHCVNG